MDTCVTHPHRHLQAIPAMGREEANEISGDPRKKPKKLLSRILQSVLY